jgi:DNA-binding MarR family transcriptional regulator
MSDLDNNLGYLFHHISAVLARQSDQILLEQLGIGFSQFKILLILAEGKGVQQRQLASTLGQTEASISRQIKLLQADGYITSQVNPNNRREHITHLTPKGVKVTEKATEILNNFHAPIFNKLSERQQVQMRELLTAMHQAICNETDH